MCINGWYGADCAHACPGIDDTTGAGVVCGVEGAGCASDGTCVCPACYSATAADGTCELQSCPSCVYGDCRCNTLSSNQECSCWGDYKGDLCDTCACARGGTCNSITFECDYSQATFAIGVTLLLQSTVNRYFGAVVRPGFTSAKMAGAAPARIYPASATTDSVTSRSTCRAGTYQPSSGGQPPSCILCPGPYISYRAATSFSCTMPVIAQPGAITLTSQLKIRTRSLTLPTTPASTGATSVRLHRRQAA